MMLCKFSGGTTLFQVLFSVPHKREKHFPDENAQLKQIKQCHSFSVVFCELRTFQVVVKKEKDLEREETTTALLFKVFVTEELKKGEKKKT